MRDEDCVRFLQWALPKLGLVWSGYRKVRGTVRKRLNRRLRTLGLADLDAYREYLSDHPEEWGRLEVLCHIPISRFYRDRAVWNCLETEALPALVTGAQDRGEGVLRALSLGCASGEEVYSLSLLWARRLAPRYPEIKLTILALDADEVMLRRAETGCYGRGSLRELPDLWLEWGFEQVDNEYRVRDVFRQDIRFEWRDIRRYFPPGKFDFILCRNLAFTYFERKEQKKVLERIGAHLHPCGVLVIGGHERLPEGATGYTPVAPALPAFRKDVTN